MRCRTWVQLTLPEFFAQYPAWANQLPPLIDFSDPDYRVRVDVLRGVVEVGYEGDDDWQLR